MSALVRTLRRLRRDEAGSMTAEAVIVIPVFLTLLLMVVEAGVLMLRHTMLDRALDIAVRDLRLGRWENPTLADVRAAICANAAVMANCMTDLTIELQPISRTTWALPTGRQPCVDRTLNIEPATTFVPGAENDLVLIRICAVFDPFFPSTGAGLDLPLDASGGYQLIAMSTFVNEPR